MMVRMMSEKERYNVHFRTEGFMVLDYEATPEDGNIYDDEKHGYQIVIRDISRAEARRVCHFLNEQNNKIKWMEKSKKELGQIIEIFEEKLNESEKDFQDYKDTVANFLFKNMGLLNDDLIRQINNELGIDLMDILELYYDSK